MGRRIVLTTFGSLGDLHPYVALALVLKARGHQPVIATSLVHRPQIEAEGIVFAAVRPDLGEFDQRETVKRAMDAKGGTEVVLRELVMPYLRPAYDDLMQIVQGADLLVTHPITYAAPLVAEKTGMLWASRVLAPISMLSAYDPPIPPNAPFLAHLRWAGPGITRALIALGKNSVRSWSDPVRALRTELGMPPGGDPIFEGQYSPHLNLALFSRVLGSPQPDWPVNTVQPGFCFYDRREQSGLSPEILRFLDAGPPPIVFTLGSSAVWDARNFYQDSVAAALRLGQRALLLIGPDARNAIDALPETIAAFAYAPYSDIFPRAAAIVHQGGAGTTGQALRAGRPMLIMPYAHDQPDHAARCARIGVGRAIARDRYTAARAARELKILLEQPAYAQRAAQAGEIVRTERGAEAACDALETLLTTASPAARSFGPAVSPKIP